MDTNRQPLTISYAGSLNGYIPSDEKNKKSWTQLPYRVQNINYNTRSGYYFFTGIKALVEKFNVTPQDIQVLFWGSIDEINKTQVREMGLEDYIHFDGYQSKEETVRRLNNSDALFLPLESGKGSQKPLFIPGKVYEYLKIGKPVFALAEDSDTKDILLKSQLGIICSPFDKMEIAEKLYYLIKNKEKLKEIYLKNTAYIESFSFRNKTKELAQVFDSLI